MGLWVTLLTSSALGGLISASVTVWFAPTRGHLFWKRQKLREERLAFVQRVLAFPADTSSTPSELVNLLQLPEVLFDRAETRSAAVKYSDSLAHMAALNDPKFANLMPHDLRKTRATVKLGMIDRRIDFLAYGYGEALERPPERVKSALVSRTPSTRYKESQDELLRWVEMKEADLQNEDKATEE